MHFIYELILLRFIFPKTLFLLFKSKKIHGNNLCFLLKLASERFGNKTAITDGHCRLSFAELYNEVNEIGNFLKKNVISDDNSTIVHACKNTVNEIVLLFSLQNLGLKIILVNHNSHINEINRFTANLSGKYYIFSSNINHFTLENAHNIDEIFTHHHRDISGFIPSKKYASVVYSTSGTTGNSKLIEKKTGAFYWLRSFTQLVTYTKIYKKNAVYISLPVSHSFGNTALIFALVLGKKAIVTSNKNQQQIAELLIKEKADLIAGVPSSLFQISEIMKEKKHCINLVISGGAHLNETIFNSICDNLTSNIFCMYGSTEASTSFIADYYRLKLNIHALGKPLMGVKYKLETIQNGSKELLIKSPLANISNEEWLHTGDLADYDNKRNLYWCGRKDNLIIKNGVNIYPAEIENTMSMLDGIEDVLVVGEDDEFKGEIIKAYVKIKNNFQFEEKQIKEKLKEVISSVKIPDKFIIVKEFGFSATGKKQTPIL